MPLFSRHRDNDDAIRHLSKSATEKENVNGISLWLDSYDDIFSDFDPRPYSHRNVSDDFIAELKKVLSESDAPVEQLQLLIQAKLRNADIERTITERLTSFFKKNQVHVLKKRKTDRRMNLAFVVAGLVFIVFAGTISGIRHENFMMRILFVILEPTGWFLVWTGMENFIGNRSRQKKEIGFYDRISHCSIHFSDLPA